jgi:uncharacterized protein (TIGR00251 family)
MPLSCLSEKKQGICLKVKAVPKSSRTEIVDLKEDRCRIKVKAPPVDGEANSALIAFLAKTFAISKKAVILKSGLKGKNKEFILSGITLKQASEVLDNIFSREKR